MGLLCIWGVVMFCGPEIIGLLCDWSAVYGLASGEGGSVLIGFDMLSIMPVSATLSFNNI